MTTINTTPTFNLKVVVAETGIKPDTLRAWERRYGLPDPQRTEGKHRLYSQYDLEVIKWLTDRQSEGLSISRAVKLWRRLEKDGQNPLWAYGEEDEDENTAVPTVIGTRVEELRQSWVEACHRFNETAAEHILAQAFAIYPPETVCLQVLMKGLSTIGNQWYEGEATVQQEHFASALAMRRLHTLLAASPPPTHRERIIVACPPQEDHAFAPLLLALLLRYRGWDVVYLGADVPLERLELTLETIKPHLVLLSAQQLHTASSLLAIAHFLREQEMPAAFGGLIFSLIPGLHKRIPGHYLGNRLEDVPHIVETLIHFDPPVPDTEPIAELYQVALNHFRQRQSQIEAHMWQKFQQADMPYEHFVNANMHMARNITSALTLGDMNYLGVELAWIKQFLDNYHWPQGTLHRYLSAYHEAVDIYLNGTGRPIVEWLMKVVPDQATVN
ncbi:MAG: MerR family transcriptional regulator [Ardenticatenaceae bacterium]|nr:MerR family transcriptional regulator [Ardenticatenaceae bacterium]MCB9445422.1 MerR family transcriptional regulator [Ardenticatenaceae bacterium]